MIDDRDELLDDRDIPTSVVTVPQVAILLCGGGLAAGIAIGWINFFRPRLADPNYLLVGVGTVLAAVSFVLMAFAVRAHRARTRHEKLLVRACLGALAIAEADLTENLARISGQLRDRFHVSLQIHDSVVDPDQMTLGQLTHSLLALLNAAQAPTETVRPASLEAARKLVAQAADCQVSAADFVLAKLIPVYQRRSFWARLAQASSLSLPRLSATRGAKGIAMFLAIAATFGIVVPLIELSDQKHPLHDPPFLIRLLAPIVMHGGFCLLLIPFGTLFVRVGSFISPDFPRACATIADIAKMLERYDPRPAGDSWSFEDVWEQVRRTVSEVSGVPELSITPQLLLKNFA